MVVCESKHSHPLSHPFIISLYLTCILPIRLYILSLPCVWLGHNSVVFSKTIFLVFIFRFPWSLVPMHSTTMNRWTGQRLVALHFTGTHTVDSGCYDCTKFSFYAKMWMVDRAYIHSIYEKFMCKFRTRSSLSCQLELEGVAKKTVQYPMFHSTEEWQSNVKYKI